jgi:hypothetical protein
VLDSAEEVNQAALPAMSRFEMNRGAAFLPNRLGGRIFTVVIGSGVFPFLPVAIRITLTALPMTSAGRRSPLGPVGIGRLAVSIDRFREATFYFSKIGFGVFGFLPRGGSPQRQQVF